jgi:subtilisin family serine protease
VSKQWYLSYSGFYSSWVTLPSFEVDSGRRHRLGGRRLASGARDEDPGRPRASSAARRGRTHSATDVRRRLIGARFDNGIGIAGLAPSAQLLVAKVVTKQRTIPVEAEAKAIRWAVDNGARVINAEPGGVRDPLDPDRDTYSRLEADADAMRSPEGVVVVAGRNSDQAPESPGSTPAIPQRCRTSWE